jgi:ketosteroid isomerase-like protein
MKRQTESKNVEAVRRLYEARGNPEVARQVLAPDVRWEVVPGFPHSDVYVGLTGVFDFFTRLFGDFEDWHSEPSEFFEAGDRVIAIGTYSARCKATGKEFSARFAHVWTIRNGVIARLQQCADTVQIARAVASREGARPVARRT